jgi:hypothetical protein
MEAFTTRESLCQVKLSFESRTTPRSQMESTLSNLWPENSYWKCLVKRDLVKLMLLHTSPSWTASRCRCTTGKKNQVQPAHLQIHCCRQQEKIFWDHSAFKRIRSDLKHEKTSFMNKIKSKGSKIATLGNAGFHRKSSRSRLRTTSFHKLLVVGQIRPYPSKKAAAESQLSRFSLQQPMADLAILHTVQYIRSKLNQIGHSRPAFKKPVLSRHNRRLNRKKNMVILEQFRKAWKYCHTMIITNIVTFTGLENRNEEGNLPFGWKSASRKW